MHDDAVDRDKLTLLIDRFKGPEPGLPTPAGARFTRWAYAPRASMVDPPIVGLARTAAEAPAALFAELRASWELLEDADRPDLEAFVDEARKDYAGGALICVTAGDELAAWRAWVAISGRHTEPAFEAWRAVFPASPGADPVGDDARRAIALETRC